MYSDAGNAQSGITAWHRYLFSFSVGAMSAVHTVTVVSVSVAVRTSLMALTNVAYVCFHRRQSEALADNIIFHVNDGFSCSNKHCDHYLYISVSSDRWIRPWTGLSLQEQGQPKQFQQLSLR